MYACVQIYGRGCSGCHAVLPCGWRTADGADPVPAVARRACAAPRTRSRGDRRTRDAPPPPRRPGHTGPRRPGPPPLSRPAVRQCPPSRARAPPPHRDRLCRIRPLIPPVPHTVPALCAPLLYPAAHPAPGTRDVLDQFDKAARLLAGHDQAAGGAAHTPRTMADDLTRIPRGRPQPHRSRSAARRHARAPHRVLDGAEQAACAPVRLTRACGESSARATYATHFWERQGAGVLVPVHDAVDPAAGMGCRV
ncbi:lantibiotic dehydratase [Streptomyces sp. enrichment culture]|uniref:lantibiotic dehydratase n=1 Tax=Streptomyces sp. enrichment culture TaxID=1795815 RepID=UPI003F56FE6A